MLLLTEAEVSKLLFAAIPDYPGDKPGRVNDGDRVYRIRTEQDTDTQIDDFDCYGRIHWIDRSWSSHPATRPDGFDGDAMKIHLTEGDVWWQPLLDEWGVNKHEWHTDTELRTKERRAIYDLLTEGWMGIIIEICEGKDAYGSLIVRASASLWGIEATHNASQQGLVDDIVAEAFGEFEAASVAA